jgi:hypothetical protein
MQLPEGEDGQSISPWERSIDSESQDFDEAIWRLLREATDVRRKEVLLKFADERPNDFEFLLGYIARNRRGRFSRQEQNRARDIIARLRRHERRGE